MEKRCNVLLGVTGSAAATCVYDIVSQLLDSNYDVKVVTTKSALQFFDKSLLTVPVYTDTDEHESWKSLTTAVAHIELRKWADIFLIAPMSANTLAKIAGGQCDNLLTCVARTWYFEDDSTLPKKYGVFAPAMNTSMWKHPLTKSHVKVLCDTLKWLMIPPVTGMLMCGDVGEGAIESTEKIVHFLRTLEF